MQNFATPHAPAQHLPAGWTFPAASPELLPAPTPVMGGGAMSATVSRVRWGRLLLVFFGVALAGVGCWAALSGTGSTASHADAVGLSPTVSGGGAGDGTPAPDARIVGGSSALAAPKVAAKAAPKTAAARAAAIRTTAVRKAAAARAAAR
ncbi:MAG: hypothetical protein JWN72_198, partial [Thermoleophilia bacterium]|nr:hypothetical protein [Thermoleophilia bacterium]